MTEKDLITPDQDPRDAIPLIADSGLFRIYQDPSSTNMTIDPNVVMTVGTGGVGIWERTWMETALSLTGKSEYELLHAGGQPGVIRAMYIAQAAAHHARMLVQNIGLRFFSLSPTGQQMARSFRKHVAETVGNDPTSMADWDARERLRNSQAISYMERHPQDGQQRFELLENAATDTLQTGQHLVYLSLYQGPRNLMDHGRRLIGFAPLRLQQAIEEPRTDDDTIIPATAGDTPAQRAASYVDLIARTCRGAPDDDDTIRHFIATACTARWALQASTRNQERLAQLGAKDGGLPSTLKDLSDQIFLRKEHDIVAVATRALSVGQPGPTALAFAKMENAEETLAAIGFGWRQPESNRRDPAPEPNPTQQDLLDCIAGDNPNSQLAKLAALGRSLPGWHTFLQSPELWASQDPR